MIAKPSHLFGKYLHRHALLAATLALLWIPGSYVSAADKVTLGLVGGLGNSGFFVALAEGYFAAEGIDIEVVPFSTAAKMIAPLGTGELDVGAGAASVGLYNAALRKVTLKIVAGFAKTAPNNPYYSLVVRKDLIESKQFKSLADLKGRKLAMVAPGASTISVLNEATKRGGIKYNDVEIVYLGFPQQVAAMQKGVIDATLTVEPFLSAMVGSGSGVIFAPVNDFYPSYQIGLVFFGEKFLTRRELAVRFMRAYVRGTRAYIDVIKNGRFIAGPNADHIVDILARAMKISDARVRSMYAPTNDPDARINLDSLRKGLAFFKAQGYIKDPGFTVDQMVDLTILDDAVAKLGPYKASSKDQ